MPVLRTPLMRQLEARECGAVALGIILAFYGKYLTLSELRETCGITREGVTILGIVRAARHYGLKAQALKRQSLQGIATPFMIYWNFNHFLVVENVSGDGIHVNDPAYGRAFLSNALIQRYFSGIVLTFEPTSAFQRTGHPPAVLPPEFFHLSLLVEIGRAGLDLAALSAMVAQSFFLGLVLLGGAYLVLRWAGLRSLEQRYRSVDLFRHTLTLPIPVFSRYYVDDIASRQMLMQNLGRQHAQALSPFVSAGRLLIYTTALVFLSPAFLISLIMAAVNGAVTGYSRKREKQAAAAHHIFTDRLTQVTFNGLVNIESIKLQGSEVRYLDQLYRAQIRAYSQPFDLWQTIPSLLPILNVITLLLVTGLLIETGNVSLPQAVIGFCVSFLVAHSGGALGQGPEVVREFKHQLDRINDLRSVLPDDTPPPAVESADITLTQVSYAYGEAQVLEGIDLHLSPGRSLGIVGRSGSGKSTLISLIAGLYPPRQGTVQIAHGHMAALDGQAFLLEGSVTDNITLFNAIPTAQIVRAAEDACLHAVIQALPQQYATAIHPLRHPFSRGQLQCLEVARALARHPSVLLLDEATNAMDALTEVHVLNTIAQRGCATVIVSHRLSAIRDCDEIIVMDKGRIVERGTHHTLLRDGSVYQHLIADRVIK